MTFIQTVLGKISPLDLGITYCHEHLLFQSPLINEPRQSEYRLDNTDHAVEELINFKRAGGGCIVEMSTTVTSRSPKGLREISKRSGVYVIAATGFHKAAFSAAYLEDKSVYDIRDMMVHDLLTGMDGTDINAGVIKASSSLDHFSISERKVIEAAALAHHATGAPISTHTEAGTMALEQIDVLTGYGVPPSSITIGHAARILEFDFLASICERGVFLNFDGISKEKFHPDSLRIQILKELVDAGFAKHIMLSSDFGKYSYFPSYGFGYGPGFTYILWRFVPRMLNYGIPREAVMDMLVHNPSQAFQFISN